LRCSTERPLVPGMPTSALRSGVSSTSSMICPCADPTLRGFEV
jgi:hypothetical protein